MCTPLSFVHVCVYSIGEFGSRKKADETVVTTCTEFDGTLGQPSVLLQDEGCVHIGRLLEAEGGAMNDGRGGGIPTGGAGEGDGGGDGTGGGGKNWEVGEGGVGEEGGGRGGGGGEGGGGEGGGGGGGGGEGGGGEGGGGEEGGGGAEGGGGGEGGGGSNVQHLKTGGDDGGNSDHEQSSRSERDLTSLSSSSNMTDISALSRPSELGHSGGERESPAHKPPTNEILKSGGETTYPEPQPSPEKSLKVARGLQTESRSFHHPLQDRDRDASVTSMATTMDFSNGQSPSLTGGPITAKDQTRTSYQSVVSTPTRLHPSSWDGVGDSEVPVVQDGEELIGAGRSEYHQEEGGRKVEEASQTGVEGIGLHAYEGEKESEILQDGVRSGVKQPPPPSQVAPRDTIGRIVKSEMKKILKVESRSQALPSFSKSWAGTGNDSSLLVVRKVHCKCMAGW